MRRATAAVQYPPRAVAGVSSERAQPQPNQQAHTSTGEGVRANVRSLIASDVSCPRCHAAPGVRCTSVRGLSHHAREAAVNLRRPCSGCGKARVECGCLL